MRVYTMVPGHPPNRERPFALRRGQTVEDVARLVHKDLARSVPYACVWAPPDSTDSRSESEHPLADGDVVELHA